MARPTPREEHLEAALKRFELVYVEMDPGDALVFDGNLLHRSDANRTDTYRWGYICSYNAVKNAPFKRVRDIRKLRAVAQGAGRFVPLGVVTNSRATAAKRDILTATGRAYEA